MWRRGQPSNLFQRFFYLKPPSRQITDYTISNFEVCSTFLWTNRAHLYLGNRFSLSRGILYTNWGLMYISKLQHKLKSQEKNQIHTSGTRVMLTKWAPHVRYKRLSASDENLGPSITTDVPPLRHFISNFSATSRTTCRVSLQNDGSIGRCNTHCGFGPSLL